MPVNAKTNDEQLDSRSKPTNKYPAGSPRFWHGMRMKFWWGLVARNGFRFAPTRLPIAAGVSFFSPWNDGLAIAQKLFLGRQIARTNIEKPPIFILGHWRSGTTLLHELLVTNKEFASPNTFQCFAPSHFLLSEYLMVRFGNFLIPKKRPMDNMEAGWTLPQEDEFALMNLGVPTPYLRIAFPKSQQHALNYLDMQGLSEKELAHWKERLHWFMRVLTYHYEGRQLVLKSPPHTGRIAQLLELFPNAKFIHLTRDPRQLFSSTMRLWRSLEEVQALQLSCSESEMKAYVKECLKRMYAGFEAGRSNVPANQIMDITYEQLVREPLQTLQDIYEQLDLGNFATAKPALEERLTGHGEYKPNTHKLDPQLEQEILEAWPDYAKRYGYE